MSAVLRCSAWSPPPPPGRHRRSADSSIVSGDIDEAVTAVAFRDDGPVSLDPGDALRKRLPLHALHARQLGNRHPDGIARNIFSSGSMSGCQSIVRVVRSGFQRLSLARAWGPPGPLGPGAGKDPRPPPVHSAGPAFGSQTNCSWSGTRMNAGLPPRRRCAMRERSGSSSPRFHVRKLGGLGCGYSASAPIHGRFKILFTCGHRKLPSGREWPAGRPRPHLRSPAG